MMEDAVQENFGRISNTSDRKTAKMRTFISFAAGMAGLLFGLDIGVIA